MASSITLYIVSILKVNKLYSYNFDLLSKYTYILYYF